MHFFFAERHFVPGERLRRPVWVPKRSVRDRGYSSFAPGKTHGPREFGVGECVVVAGQGQEAVEEV